MLVLIVLANGVIYSATVVYINYARDQALRAKMARALVTLRLRVPDALQVSSDAESDIDGLEGLVPEGVEEVIDPYDDDAAWSFVATLDADAHPIQTITGGSTKGLNLESINMADPVIVPETGFDLHTLYTANGDHVRLLTYGLPGKVPARYLQAGMSLIHEDRVKHRFLLILFAGSTLLCCAAGGLSWLMTKHTLRATWRTFEQQQSLVANASHELRTPLTLIRASAQFVQKSLAPDNPQRQLMDDVLSETDHMTKLIDDLLLLSRLDAHNIKLDLRPIQLADILSDVERHFISLAAERKVHICLGRIEGCVMADSTRLWQIILILVDNAMRHTPPDGSVTLSSTYCEHNSVEIRVADTGEGINQKDLVHIFERFYSANSNHTGRYSTGLGLSIAKPLVELHGGTIHINSRPGEGTTAVVRLPALPAASTYRVKQALNT